MPDFKNNEEYEKWKAERFKDKAEKLKEQQWTERLRQEEKERLSTLWICPECLNANDNPIKECQCGYTPNKKYFEYFKGNLTVAELYEIITDNNLKDDDKEVFLSFYLLKRFPETTEATKIKKLMDYDSKAVVCGKCGSNNIYNSKFYKKDTCEKCGDFLYQYVKEDSKKGSAHKKDDSDLVTSIGWVLVFAGVFVVVGSLMMDTAPEGIHNIGLLNKKQNFLIVSSLMILIGVALLIASFIKKKE